MITVQQHEKLIDRIASLSELELDSLLKDIGQHLQKNNLEHLIDNAFQVDDQAEEIEGLEAEVQELEEKIELLETDRDNLQVKIDEAVDLLEDVCPDGHDSLSDKSKIEEIIKLLQ